MEKKTKTAEKYEKMFRSYARLHTPVSPMLKMEPVSELKLVSGNEKYKVDAIWRDEHTLYWELKGVIRETPWSNVVQTELL